MKLIKITETNGQVHLVNEDHIIKATEHNGFVEILLSNNDRLSIYGNLSNFKTLLIIDR